MTKKQHDGAPETDDLLEFMIDRQKKAGCAKGLNSLTYMAKDSELLWTGIELPSLALKWLFDSNVLPLGHIIGLAGPPQSQKSSLALEIARWLLSQNGAVSLLDCEGGKISDTLMGSILSDAQMARLTISACPTIDQAQAKLTALTGGLRDLKRDKGKHLLYGLIVDSLTGAPTESYSAKVNKEGHDVATFGDMAKSWTGYLRKISGDLLGQSALLVFVNHQKEQATTYGPPKKVTPGGVGQEYHASIYLWVKRLSLDAEAKKELKAEEEALKGGGIRRLQLETRKSSMGIEGRKVRVSFTWWYDENGKQTSLFNWAEADGVFLGEHQKDPGVSEVCAVKCFAGQYSCERLGLTKVSAEELGRAVAADKGLTEELQKVMHIKKHKLYDGSWESPV